MSEVIADRQMPIVDWEADFSLLVKVRRLATDEIQLIGNWKLAIGNENHGNIT